MCVGLSDNRGSTVYNIEHGQEPYGEKLKEIKERIEAADLLIGFNLKFDISWIRRYIDGIRIPRVFDCQLAEFLLCYQQTPYPSLDESCARHGLGRKLDVVALNYWAKGIDTPDIPYDVLEEYCAHDVDLTLQLFHKQKELLKGNQKRLFILQCEDLLGLQEAEQNGLRYDFDKATAEGLHLQEEIKKIDGELCKLAGVDFLNFNSNDQLSALLYGGVVNERVRETTTRTLKDGTIKVGERWGIKQTELPRLVKPLPGSESSISSRYSDDELSEVNRERLATGKAEIHRVYGTAAPVLSRLKCKGRGRKIIDLVLRRAEYEKLDSTYYTGLLNKAEEMEWPKDEIHGQFNLVVASTGRLSSSQPNTQNFSGEIKELFYSRYE